MLTQPLHRALLAAALLPVLVLAGCATAPPGPASLAGSRWQLVAVASMDDAQGTVRPADPTRYSLAFHADGRAVLQLDCNRGTAGWQAEPAGNDTPGRRSGSLQFGALASTRAMCPPGSLAPQLVRALPHVRSYLLVDGRLHLSLLADGGILTWSPAP